MNLRHLEIFHAIMQTGSVSAAARRLNVSQPSVSTVLKHAEASLGVPLFERVAGRLIATAEAHSLLPEVSEVFDRVDLIGKALSEMRSGQSRELIVASSPTLANTLLSRAISKLRHLRPKTRVVIHSLLTPAVVTCVEKRQADIGLVYGVHTDVGVRCEQLASSPIVCAVPLTHRLALRDAISAADLAGESIVSLGPTSPIGSAIAKECRAVGLVPPPIAIEASSSFGSCVIAAEGSGIALVDRTTLLVKFFPQLAVRAFIPNVTVDISLIMPRGRRISPAGEDLAGILRRLTSSP